MSDIGRGEPGIEAEEDKLILFAKCRPFDANKHAALLARLDAVLERSAANLREYEAIVAILSRDYAAREEGNGGVISEAKDT